MLKLKSINQLKKKKKKHDKIVLLGKDKLNTIEVLMALIDSYVSHDEFILANDVVRQYNEEKEEIKHPETSIEYII